MFWLEDAIRKMNKSVEGFAKNNGISRSTAYRRAKKDNNLREIVKKEIITEEFDRKIVLERILGAINTYSVSMQIMSKEFTRLQLTVECVLAAENKEIDKLKPRCAEIINKYGKIYSYGKEQRKIAKLSVMSYNATDLLPLSMVYGNKPSYSTKLKTWTWCCEGVDKLAKISMDLLPLLEGDVKKYAEIVVKANKTQNKNEESN